MMPITSATHSLLKRWLALITIFSLALGSGFLALAQSPNSGASLVHVLAVDGPIGPATAHYLEQGLAQAEAEGANAVVLRLDTPGGLDASMRTINKAILASPVPVLSFVSPSGARAASAGTYMLYASHIAAMTPGTNLGAATPVRMGGSNPLPDFGAEEEPSGDTPANGEEASKEEAMPRQPPADAMTSKIINDAVAYIRGLAELRGRNAEWAERAVRGAESLSYRQALDQQVIDFIATDIDDLLTQANGKTVLVAGQEQALDLANPTLKVVEPDWRTRFLEVISNPNIAFVLMLIGIYGLIFEFANPGALVPGTIGAICLLLAFFALDVLPINYAGLALLLLGMGLMIAEAFVPSFGILGLGGVAAFIVGGLMLFDTEAPGFSLSWPMVISAAVTTGLLSLLVVTIALKAQGRPVMRREGTGQEGVVVSWEGNQGRVRVEGEVWQATTKQEALMPGQTVVVKGRDGLILSVEAERSRSPFAALGPRP